jgi:hypothetical protein
MRTPAASAASIRFHGRRQIGELVNDGFGAGGADRVDEGAAIEDIDDDGVCTEIPEQ